MGAGLTLIRSWANAGTRIKPSDGKIDQGWLAGEQPPVEYENERMYSRDTLVNQIITYLNDGVPLSDIVTSATDDLTITDSDSSSKMDANTIQTGVTTIGSSTLFGIAPSGFVSRLIDPGGYISNIRFISVDVSGLTWSVVDTLGTSTYRYRRSGTVPTLTGVPANANTHAISSFLKTTSTAYSIPCEVNLTYDGSNNLIVSDIYVITGLSLASGVDTLDLVVGDVIGAI